MRRTSIVGLHIVVSTALAIGLLVAELATTSSPFAQNETVYAIDATPSPSTTAIGLLGQRLTSTPTPTMVGSTSLVAQPIATALVTPNPLATAPVAPNPGVASAPPSALQQVGDQIGAVSQQVAQAVQDPSLSTDAKVERINMLATQFNQLVAQWQQQLAQLPASTGANAAPACVAPCTQQAPAPSVAGVQATATPFGQVRSPGVTPTPSTTLTSPGGGVTADQLRAQISAISNQMAQVSQDPTLAPDVKNTQLSSLATQFNQLMMQLQQLGG